MKIQDVTGQRQMMGRKVNFRKKENAITDGLILGNTEQTPDFLQKNLICQKAAYSKKEEYDGGPLFAGSVFGGFTGAIAGGFGWAADACFGKYGGLAAIGLAGALSFGMCVTGDDKDAGMGLISAIATAGATLAGMHFGPMGILYGGVGSGVIHTVAIGNHDGWTKPSHNVYSARD